MGLGSILKGIAGIGASLIPGVGPIVGPLVTAGLAGVGGALENTQGARTTTTTPTLAPEYKTLADLLRTRAEDRLRQSTDLGGYTANGISDINNAFSGINQSIANNLTTRGLATSPVAATVDAKAQLARAGNIASFLNTIPLLQRQMQTEDMNAALPILSLGRGTTSVGPGSAVAGGLGSAAEMLAYLQGRGILGGNTPKLGGGTGYPSYPDTGVYGPGF